MSPIFKGIPFIFIIREATKAMQEEGENVHNGVKEHENTTIY